MAYTQLLEYMPPNSARPGMCYRCGATDGPAIDWGVDIDMEGALVMCVGCVQEAAYLTGMLPAEKAKELRDNNRRYGQKNKALQAANESLQLSLFHLTEAKDAETDAKDGGK